MNPLRTTLALTLAALALGCGGSEKKRRPRPAAEEPPPAATEQPAPQAEPKPATEPPPPPPPEGPVRIEPRRTPSAAQRTFGPDVLDRIRIDDHVDVTLGRGRASGVVRGLSATEIVLAMEGSQIVARFSPNDVKEVKLVYRDPEQTRAPTVGGAGPTSDEEGWLERFADRAILEGTPAELWEGRFKPNPALVVARPFTVGAWAAGSRKGGAPVFVPSSTRAQLREQDQVKLVGLCAGLEARPGGDRPLPEVNLYLVKRAAGGAVEPLYSTELLHPSDLDPASVQRFMDEQPVTLAVWHPGEVRHIKIQRLTGRAARGWAGQLERTPERVALRAWRANKPAELAAAEARVKKILAAVGLTTDAQHEKPVLFELRIPSSTGGVRLLPFRKELGLD